MDLLNLGLLYHGFRDAVREGWNRVVIYWKAMMILFRASPKWNYSKEAFLLLLQLSTSSERVAEAIKWSRFINRKGRVGCNVPCDLAMEHLNRRLKCVISQLGANVRPSAIVRASRSIRVVDTVCELFEHSVEASISGDHHTMAKDIKDFNLVLGVLMKELFKEENGRSHRNSIFLCDKKFMSWIESLVKQYQKKKICKRNELKVKRTAVTKNQKWHCDCCHCHVLLLI